MVGAVGSECDLAGVIVAQRRLWGGVCRWRTDWGGLPDSSLGLRFEMQPLERIRELVVWAAA